MKTMAFPKQKAGMGSPQLQNRIEIKTKTRSYFFPRAKMFHSRVYFFTILCFSIGFSYGEPYGSRNYGSISGSQDAIEEHDLLQAIHVPFDDPRTQYFEAGLDGFPAYGLREGADVKSPYRLFLPESLYRDFALLATIKPERREPSYIFAVVNPHDTIVQFGLKISPSLTSSHHMISLMYTDVGSHIMTQELVSFEVPLMTRKWNRFALKVIGDNVTLFLNCREHSSKMVMRNPKELSLDPASTLYIGQAGPIVKENFQGAIQELKLYGNHIVSEVQCEDAFSSFGSAEGSSPDFTNTNDLNDFYDYPTYDDDEEIEETGSGGFPPPTPTPPPPAFDLNSLFGGRVEPQGGKDKINRNPSVPFVSTKSKPGFHSRGSRLYKDNDELDFEGSGVCHCNHTEILLKLPETLRGLPGPKGEVGPSGPAGPTGMPGAEGKQGIAGERGERGDIGARGAEGIQGPKGEPGVAGPVGLPGPAGAPGKPGNPTFMSLDPDWRPRNLLKESLGSGNGMMMARPGMPGPKGERGENGGIGPKGERGSMGDKGERGQEGAPGEKGERGHSGPKGDAGTSGIDGLPGAPGKDGEKGAEGPAGPQGPPGMGSSISLDEILNKIETIKGERGDIGPVGPAGERGLPGLKGDTGEAGPPGAPATLQMMDESYTPVKGEKGDQGRRGRRGKPGLPGLPGAAGDFGIPGWPKIDGGRPGPPGLAIQGPKGEKGEPAALPDNFFNYEVSSLRGPPGLPGPPGPPGQNYVPVAGPPGPKGEPGLPGSQGNIGRVVGAPGTGESSSSSSQMVPGAVVFVSREAMLKMSEYSPVGTIAFAKQEQGLFARVTEGWKPILLGKLIPAPPQMTGMEMTTEFPKMKRPPFKAYSLTNKLEGPTRGMEKIRLAALNDPSNGDIRGVRGADYSCYRQARNSNLQGTFRAFLTSWVQNLDSIVKHSDRNFPVANIKGEILFGSWMDIFYTGGKFVTNPPQLYSFNGKNVFTDFHWPQKLIWHGANTSGVRVSNSYCDAWHTDSVSENGLASDLFRHELMGQQKVGCNQKLIVLCIEIASQHHYRKRREVNSNPASYDDSDSSPMFQNFEEDNELTQLSSKYADRLHNLTFEEYSQFIDDYDQATGTTPYEP